MGRLSLGAIRLQIDLDDETVAGRLPDERGDRVPVVASSAADLSAETQPIALVERYADRIRRPVVPDMTHRREIARRVVPDASAIA